MELLVKALGKKFDTLNQSSMLETFIPSLYQYVSLIVKNSYLLPLIQELENREVEITQKCQDRYLKFLKETEIFPHWKKIKACINIAGKNHNEAAALFLKKQDLSVLDFLHFRAGNNSLRGASTDKQIQSYQTSAAIVHNYLIEHIESRMRAGFATTRQNQVPAPPNARAEINKNEPHLKSITLVTESLEPKEVIFVVMDEHFDIPIRCKVNNHKRHPAYIKKLYDLSYTANAPGKRVPYNKNLSDSINNGLFRLRQIENYMKTNNLSKPTLVKKSGDGKILVLKNEITMKTTLIKNLQPQYQYLYIDKTR